MTEETTETIELKIPESPRSTLEVEVEGTSMLVVSRFSEKAKREIRQKQQNLAKPKKGARSPEAEYEASAYRFEDGGYGIPTGAFAEAIVDASVDHMKNKKSMLRRNFFVECDGIDKEEGKELTRILGGEPSMREDVVRLAGISRTADLRYRAAFQPGWRAKIRIRWDEKSFSKEQIVQLIQTAGESIGVCEGRPQKTLSLGWGKFKPVRILYTPAKVSASVECV